MEGYNTMEDNLLFNFILAQADDSSNDAADGSDGEKSNDASESTGEKNGTKADGSAEIKEGAKKDPPGFSIESLIPIVLMVAVMYFFVFRGPKKRQNDQKKMMEELKKNDRIQTIGGIRGTIVDVRDDDEVVVKIDESNNTKMRIARRAIATVITDDQPEKK